ncbi:MAG: response regulator transcription factor [Lachnospiraceae bacterium]|nr:response regulator transcription factor [Lachnospiraceae bacterium]
MKSILLLEDDENLSRGISLKLGKEGYRVFSSCTISEAESIFRKETIDLVISDITLPDGSGLDFGNMVREKSNAILIYLTAMDQEIDIVNGYDTGADDYITKPFSVNILTSKVNAFMRRLGHHEEGVYISGDIEVFANDMQVKKAGVLIALSKTELQLLILFLENAGHILSRESILEKVWGIDGQFVDDNTVAVNISRLKNKLGTDSIENVRGLGYLWTEKVNKK